VELSDPARIELRYLPLYLSMEVAGYDEHHPTIEMQTTCCLADMFTYEGNLHISTEVLDSFTSGLVAITNGKAESTALTDLSDWFKLSVSRHPKGALCEVSAYYYHSGYSSEGRLNFSFPTNYEIIGMLRDRFRDFPKWW
jgi:hypothetical protein